MDVGQDEATACSLLKEMALKIHKLVGARMHHLSVCQWEVKLKLDSDGPASGSWRVVTTNVTGHTCNVDVSFIHLHLIFVHITNETKVNICHLYIELPSLVLTKKKNYNLPLVCCYFHLMYGLKILALLMLLDLPGG